MSKTLKDYQAEHRYIKNEIAPNLLCVRDAITNELVVANADANGNVTVSSGVNDIKESYIFDYSVITVNTTDYTEIIASTLEVATAISVFDSSGEIIEFAVGDSGSEERKFIIYPGGVDLKLLIALGTRISIKSLSNAPTTGQLIINFIS